jgi:hypothetical protein
MERASDIKELSMFNCPLCFAMRGGRVCENQCPNKHTVTLYPFELKAVLGKNTSDLVALMVCPLNSARSFNKTIYDQR